MVAARRVVIGDVVESREVVDRAVLHYRLAEDMERANDAVASDLLALGIEDELAAAVAEIRRDTP